MDGIIWGCTVNVNPVATGNSKGVKWVGGMIGGVGAYVNLEIKDFTFTGTAQSTIIPDISAQGNAQNNVGLVNEAGEYIVGVTSLHTIGHTADGALYEKGELNSRAYIITNLETNYNLKCSTDSNYKLCSWSNDNGHLYYFKNGYTGPSGTVQPPTWAGDNYGVLASGGNQNNPMYNTSGIEPMGDCDDPQTLLWLVIEISSK